MAPTVTRTGMNAGGDARAGNRLITTLRKNAPFLLMAAPGILLLIVFSYIPMFGIIIAFENYRAVDGIFNSAWVGLKNLDFLFKSPAMSRITFNTLFLNMLFIVTGTIAAVGLALLLNEVRFKLAARTYQTIVFFPYFISWVIVGYFSYALLNSDNGLLNNTLHSLGMQEVAWYSSPQYWPTILTATNIWKGVGYGSVIYLAGMLGINQEYYEAAQLDGANKWHQIRYITLPHLVPILVITTLLAIGRIFYADFGLIYYTTRDNSLLYSTTDVIDTYVFRALRVNADVGMAAATGLYQSFVGFVLVVLSNWMVKRISPDRALF